MQIITPKPSRLLGKEYVDKFFVDGSLRLSSFKNFHKHEDEQRKDQKEGDVMYFHITTERGGQTIEARGKFGSNAYILSTTINCSEELMRNFECDSYIRINNSTKFGLLISEKIPNLLAAYEGMCIYQDHRIIKEDLGYIDISKFNDKKEIQKFITSRMQHIPLFLKERKYSMQMEYRFVWLVEKSVSGHLDIKVPEAIQFCEKPTKLTK